MALEATGLVSEGDRLRVVISGASGTIGRALAASIRGDNGDVRTLVRGPHADAARNTFRWNTETKAVDPAAFDGASVVFHLAGESVLGRWTKAKRERIIRSRTEGTRAVLEAAASAPSVRCIVSASAIGAYGFDPDAQPADEDTPFGSGFLADVVRQWEQAAADSVSDSVPGDGPRLVLARIGVVLSTSGGALATMIRPARVLRCVAVLGRGTQWVSWVSLDDTIASLRFCADTEACAGPINIVAPGACQQQELATLLAKRLRAIRVRAPRFALKTVGGDFADEVLLCGRRVLPARLQQLGFEMRHQDLGSCLDSELGPVKSE